MNIKRLIAAGASAAMIFGATAVPVFACDWWDCDGSDPFTLIKNKDTNVTNFVNIEANTGNNYISKPPLLQI